MDRASRICYDTGKLTPKYCLFQSTANAKKYEPASVCNPFSFKEGGGVPCARKVAGMFQNGHVPKWTLFVDILDNLLCLFRCIDQTQHTFCDATSDRVPTIGQSLQNLIMRELPASLKVVTNLGTVVQGFLVTRGLHRTSNCQDDLCTWKRTRT